VAYLKSPEILR